MTWFGRSVRSPIGLDVGTHHVKAVQLGSSGDSWRITAAVAVPRTDSQTVLGQEELARFVGLLERQGFIGRDVVLAVPNPMLLGGILQLPPRDSGAPLDQIAQMELARMHKRQPDGFKMAIWDLPAAARETAATRVMSVACEHQDANQLLDLFETAGVNVLALDTAAWALARACEPLWKGQSGVTGILDLGWDSARLIVLYEGVIIYERSVAEGGIRVLRDGLIERTGLEPKVVDHLIAEEGLAGDRQSDLQQVPELTATVESYIDQVAQELRTSFSYASHRYRQATIQGVILVGGGACVGGLSRALKEAAELELRPATLGQLVECPPQVASYRDTATLTVALGLAQHGRVS